MTGRDKAVELLTHYLRLPWEHAGLGWDHENSGEVEQIVDELMRAVRDEIQEHAERDEQYRRAHAADRYADRYPDGSTS